ncbi:MAG: DUF2851 family protein [bacterium]
MHRGTPYIHERFLRHIWSRQYLSHTQLTTVDGKALQIIDAGELNLDGGPDFKNAIIQIGSTRFAGEVEIHRNTVEWLRHLHQQNPRYNKVVLHVVLEGSVNDAPTIAQSGREIHTLVLEPFLSESIRSLWKKIILDEHTRAHQRIRCQPFNGEATIQSIVVWVQHLAVERLELKLRRFDERLRDLAYAELLVVREPRQSYGPMPVRGNTDDVPPPFKELTIRDLSKKGIWEQVLYEGLLECLGYSKNQEPFVRLARNVPLQSIQPMKLTVEQLEAVLFGSAGLLPKSGSLVEAESKHYVKSLRTTWNALRKQLLKPVLHAADWQFFPTRPSNFPTIRIAAAAVLAHRFITEDLFRTTIQILKSELPIREKQAKLIQKLTVETSEFWKQHYHFDQTTSRPVRALGVERIKDMVVNCIIPVALLYARTFKDKEVRESTLQLYNGFPPLMPNAVTLLMEKQLLNQRALINTVSLQQGIIHLYKYYCKDDRCSECEIGRTLPLVLK